MAASHHDATLNTDPYTTSLDSTSQQPAGTSVFSAESSPAQHIGDVTLQAGSNHDRPWATAAPETDPTHRHAPVSSKTSTGLTHHQTSVAWPSPSSDQAY